MVRVGRFELPSYGLEDRDNAIIRHQHVVGSVGCCPQGFTQPTTGKLRRPSSGLHRPLRFPFPGVPSGLIVVSGGMGRNRTFLRAVAGLRPAAPLLSHPSHGTTGGIRTPKTPLLRRVHKPFCYGGMAHGLGIEPSFILLNRQMHTPCALPVNGAPGWT